MSGRFASACRPPTRWIAAGISAISTTGSGKRPIQLTHCAAVEHHLRIAGSRWHRECRVGFEFLDLRGKNCAQIAILGGASRLIGTGAEDIVDGLVVVGPVHPRLTALGGRTASMITLRMPSG